MVKLPNLEEAKGRKTRKRRKDESTVCTLPHETSKGCLWSWGEDRMAVHIRILGKGM